MTKGENRLNSRTRLSKALGRLSSVLLLTFAVTARGQETTATPEPKPSPIERSVRISFLPPPLDGTISLGIYDPKGKLVRVLHREADTDEFDIGADALSTTWDGKDDTGENVPAGKYTARGFVVGEIKVDGVEFFFNDFITDADSPRIRGLSNVRLQDDELFLDVNLLGNKRETIALEPKQGAFLRRLPLEDAKHCDEKPAVPNVVHVIDCAFGMDGTLWLIDSLENGARREIKQLSMTHQVLRRMTIGEGEPQPQAIAASTTEDRIFLVEAAPQSSVNRLRALSLASSKTDPATGEVSDWKMDFEKKIIEHRDFSIENGKAIPNNPKNKIQPEKVSVKLQPNPLLADARVTAEIALGFDAEGSFFKTADGLPLFGISETPGIIRGLLVSRRPGGIDVFQDDGAVVEQFQVTGVDQMMNFDCGSIELK